MSLKLFFNIIMIFFFIIPPLSAQISPFEKMDSSLYEFIVSSDKEEKAKRYGIFYQDGKLRVLLIFSSQITPIEKEKIFSTHKINVEKESPQSARALVPIEEIVEITKNPYVRFIQLPDRPLPLSLEE